MVSFEERRREKRLRYHWPVWFAEDFNETLMQGQMIDVSSGGAAFRCHADKNCPYPGQKLTAKFSVPKINTSDDFEMASFTWPATVCRVDELNSFTRRIAVQFAKPLPFKPAEHVEDSEIEQRLKAVTI